MTSILGLLIRPGPATWKRNLRVLWIAQFVAMIGMSACLPFLPLYVRELGVGSQEEAQIWSGIINAAPFVLSALSTPLWGSLGDRYGRKLMVIRAVLGLALVMAAMGFAQDVWQLFALRLVQGLVSGFVASTLAFVSADAPSHQSGYAIGMLQTTIAAGNLIGPMLGGPLAGLLGMREVFFATGILCGIAGIIVVYNLKEKREPPSGLSHRTGVVQNLREAISTPEIRLPLILIIVAQSALAFPGPILPFYLESLGAPDGQVATLTGILVGIVGLMSLFFTPFWARRADATGTKRVVQRTSFFGGLFMLAQVLVPGYLYLFPIRAVVGVFAVAVVPGLYSLISKASPKGRQSGFIGLGSSANLVGNLVAPALAGTLSTLIGLRATFAIPGLLMIAVTLVMWLRKKQEDADV